MTPFDFSSAVAVEEQDTSTSKAGTLPPPPVVAQPGFDFASARPAEDMDSALIDNLPLNPPKPLFQKITDFAMNPVGEAARAAAQFEAEKGYKDWKAVEFLPLHDDANKERDSSLIAGATGIPQGEIAQHYDALKALYHLSTGDPASIGADIGKRMNSTTSLGIINATMTPAIIAAVAANPASLLSTGAGLVVYAGLNHIIQPERFITPDMTKEQADTVRLMGIIGVGALSGGLIHGAEGAVSLDHEFKLPEDVARGLDTEPNPIRGGYGDAVEKYAYQILQENGLPDTITLAPTALERIYQKQKVRQDESKARAEAIARAVSDSPLPGDADILKVLGIESRTVETAISNGLAVKVKAEKLARVAAQFPDDFAVVVDSVHEAGPQEPAKQVTAAGERSSLTKNQSSAASVDVNKDSGLAKSIEAKAVEQGLASKGFNQLAGYEGTTLEEQAKISADVVNKGEEYLRSVIRGEEPLPPNLRGFSLIVATEKYLTTHPNPDLAYELANSPLVTMVSEAASELSSGQNRVQDSATARLQEVKKARAEKVKKLTKETPRKIAKAIMDETKKVNLSKAELSWDKLLKEIEC